MSDFEHTLASSSLPPLSLTHTHTQNICRYTYTASKLLEYTVLLKFCRTDPQEPHELCG